MNLPTEFMSFSIDLRALRNGKTYSKFSHPKMSVSAKYTVDTSTSSNSGRIKGPANGILHELIEQKITANLGLLNEQLSTLTHGCKNSRHLIP